MSNSRVALKRAWRAGYAVLALCATALALVAVSAPRATASLAVDTHATQVVTLDSNAVQAATTVAPSAIYNAYGVWVHGHWFGDYKEYVGGHWVYLYCLYYNGWLSHGQSLSTVTSLGSVLLASGKRFTVGTTKSEELRAVMVFANDTNNTRAAEIYDALNRIVGLDATQVAAAARYNKPIAAAERAGRQV